MKAALIVGAVSSWLASGYVAWRSFDHFGKPAGLWLMFWASILLAISKAFLVLYKAEAR